MDRPAATSSTTSEMPASASSTRTDSSPNHAFVPGIRGDGRRCLYQTLRRGVWVFCLKHEREHMTSGELREAFGS